MVYWSLLQVGDQMGDKHSGAFARAVANKLRTCTWTDKQELESMFIVSLNSNLKGLIFKHLAAYEGMIRDVARSWPLTMQLVCISLITLHRATLCLNLLAPSTA